MEWKCQKLCWYLFFLNSQISKAFWFCSVLVSDTEATAILKDATSFLIISTVPSERLKWFKIQYWMKAKTCSRPKSKQGKEYDSIITKLPLNCNVFVESLLFKNAINEFDRDHSSQTCSRIDYLVLLLMGHELIWLISLLI